MKKNARKLIAALLALTMALALWPGMAWAADETGDDNSRISLAGATVTLQKYEYTYTGHDIKPVPKVEINGTTLVRGRDYILLYEKNNKDITASISNSPVVVVSGMGGYIGDKPIEFVIVPADIAKASVTAPANRIYNGKPHTPDVKMSFNQKRLKKDRDYTLTYKKNTNVGTATVTIRGKGNFTGTKKTKFQILAQPTVSVPVPPAVSVPAPPKGTKLTRVTAGKKRFTAKWKKQTSGTTGYQLQYSTSKKFKCGKKTVTIKKKKTTSRKITKLKGKKTYYVRVRTYKTVKGKTYYSAWSKAKAVTTKK